MRWKGGKVVADLIVYTLAGCPYCRNLLERYRNEGLSFREISLSGNPDLRKKIKEEYAAERVPVVVRDGKLVQSGDDQGRG